jgi:hypothetical protein
MWRVVAFAIGLTVMAGSALPVTAAWEEPEGCNVGYWKQRAHLPNWGATGYSPTDKFSAVFRANTFRGLTLRQVLRQPGRSKVKALGREAVAGLLNSATPDLFYALRTIGERKTEPGEVKTLFRTGIRKDLVNRRYLAFRAANQAGCPMTTATP